MTMILIFLLLPIALTFFLPFMFVFQIAAFFCGVATVLFGLGALYNFDITDSEDWKMLFFSLVLPGGATFLFYKIGEVLGDLTLMDLINKIF